MRQIALVLFFFGLCSATWASAMKVGVVDLQKAFSETKKGKTVRSQLEKEYEKKKKDLDAEQVKLQKLGEELQKKTAVLNDKAKQEKGMEFQQKLMALQEKAKQAEGEMQGRQAELIKPVIEGLRTMVPDIAKKRGLEMVFDDSQQVGMVSPQLVFASDKTDITDELVRLYDEKNPQ